MTVFQEDISKLRRKIEKAKKPAEKISNGDDILNEEINDYKVSVCDTENTENILSSFISLNPASESKISYRAASWMLVRFRHIRMF